MRKGFEGLYGLVRERLEANPPSGHAFVFANARRNRLQLLFFDGSGLWVCAKRLEKGRYSWPEAVAHESRVTLSHEALAPLVGGHRLIDDTAAALVPQGSQFGGRASKSPMKKPLIS